MIGTGRTVQVNRITTYDAVPDSAPASVPAAAPGWSWPPAPSVGSPAPAWRANDRVAPAQPRNIGNSSRGWRPLEHGGSGAGWGEKRQLHFAVIAASVQRSEGGGAQRPPLAGRRSESW